MRILSLDIETTPNLAYTWGIWDQNIGLPMLVETSRVMCFAAKWSDAKRVMFFSEFDNGHDEMIREAHRLLDQADVVMHYNGTKFDIPHLNREFLEAGLPPPSPFAEIDLLKTARRRFKFQSNKLDHISQRLLPDGKVKHEGFGLWTKCMAGDPAAWRRMKRYNVQDVKLLEELYAILLPWIPSHPNRGLHDGRPGCPKCGSPNVVGNGCRRTATSTYQRWRCNDCGGHARSTKRDAGVDLVAVD